ncbi:hypothetical protein B1218_38830, partial [Pseudomonas ogarae]
YLAAALFDRYTVIAVETLHVSAPARQQGVRQRPQFAQGSVQGRAGQAQPLAGVERPGGRGGGEGGGREGRGGREEEEGKGGRRKKIELLGQQGVGGEDQIGRGKKGET